MRFEKYCFGLGVPVVPVAMKVINPWPLEVGITRRAHRLSTGCGRLRRYLYAPLDRLLPAKCITSSTACQANRSL
jgi:hypothetical protein